MRIIGFEIKSVAGAPRVSVENLSDVVVIAGPNGVGKTRLISSILTFLRNPKLNDNINLTIVATSDSESREWGSKNLDTKQKSGVTLLTATLRKSQRRSKYRSTVLYFDSDRSIVKVNNFNYSWDIPDPLEEDVGWDQSFSYLRDRYQDVQDSLFKLVEVQRRKIADDALKLRASGASSMPINFPDPLKAFKDAFFQLLGPKQLTRVDLKSQQIFYDIGGQELPITTLSSGEREVVNIVFDFLLRQPSHCVVFFDEPELHLHPELSYKLLQTLSAIGGSNQFIFCTHSPEIITASIEHSVIFISPNNNEEKNQAIIVNRDDETHNALNLLGQSIGVISLGRKLLLIEGDEASIDKQTYGAILKNKFPELVLVPVGGKGTVVSFKEISKSVLNRTIWGVEFFMLCDRDAIYNMGPQSMKHNSTERLRELPRYHLENYFLDSAVLAKVFNEMELPESWLNSPGAISAKLREIAKGIVPYAVALKVSAHMRERIGNVDIMPSEISDRTSLPELIDKFASTSSGECTRITEQLKVDDVAELATAEFESLCNSIDDDTLYWQKNVPGRVVLKKFCRAANISFGHLKLLYLSRAANHPSDPFLEIRDIFESFRKLSVRTEQP